MSIDIIIVNFQGAHDAAQCLARLGTWLYSTVWIVDNSNCARETERPLAMCIGLDWVRVLVANENLGFGRGWNLAFDQSSSTFVLLLNPDARIKTDDLLLLARNLAVHPQLGAVSPKTYWNEKRSFVLPAAFPQTPWHSMAMAVATRYRWLAGWAAMRELGKAGCQMASEHVFNVSFLAGAVMMLRRNAVLAAGSLFDPDYLKFFEDSDLSLRLRKAGYTLAIVPTASAAHEYRHKALRDELMAESQLQFFQKQFPVFFRLSGELSSVSALSQAVVVGKWFRDLSTPIKNRARFY